MERMYCSACGRDRSVPASAATPGPCPCGSSFRQSWKPDQAFGGQITVTDSGYGKPWSFTYTATPPTVES